MILKQENADYVTFPLDSFKDLPFAFNYLLGRIYLNGKPRTITLCELKPIMDEEQIRAFDEQHERSQRYKDYLKLKEEFESTPDIKET